MKNNLQNLILPILLLVNVSASGQHACGTAISIPSLPFSATNLSTSSANIYSASTACSEEFNDEAIYIFKYNTLNDEQITINVSTPFVSVPTGIYVFGTCTQPLTQCIAFAEGEGDPFNLNLVVSPGQDYYIVIATDGAENFDIAISKEVVVGVAINKAIPTQAFDVNGAIRIGEGATAPYAGTIRWNVDSREFEGYTGTEWVSLSPKREFGYPAIHGKPKTASDGTSNDLFGNSVSISGDYAIVGAKFHDIDANPNQGAAYIFHKVGDNWVEEYIWTASDGVSGDQFGNSVSISGDYVIVGASFHDTNGNFSQGKAYIYKRSGTTWIQEAILTASDGAAGDGFGHSVSISGDNAIIGSNSHDTNGNVDQGKAYIYKRSGTTWTQEAILTASDGAEDDGFGHSVSISGDYVIVGAVGQNTNGNLDQGKAYIYKRSGTTWTQEAILTASDGATSDLFGISVSISGDNAIVGAYLHDTNGNQNQGKAYIYKRSGTTWNQEAILTASDGAASDQLGVSVSISGHYAVVGAIGHDTNGNLDQGKAYIYKKTGDTWTQESILTASDGAGDDQFGASVSILGDDAIVGAIGHDINGNSAQGKVYFY